MCWFATRKPVACALLPDSLSGTPLWSVAPLPILGAGVTRNTVWETLSRPTWSVLWAPHPFPEGPALDLCPGLPQSSILSKWQKVLRCRALHLQVLIFCPAPRKPFKQVGLDCAGEQARSQSSASRRSPEFIRTGLINGKKRNNLLWTQPNPLLPWRCLSGSLSDLVTKAETTSRAWAEAEATDHQDSPYQW